MAIEVRGPAPSLQVFDMPRAVAFYRGCLGFELMSGAADGDRFGWCLLRPGEAWLMLNYDPDDERPASPDPARQAAHGDTTERTR